MTRYATKEERIKCLQCLISCTVREMTDRNKYRPTSTGMLCCPNCGNFMLTKVGVETRILNCAVVDDEILFR